MKYNRKEVSNALISDIATKQIVAIINDNDLQIVNDSYDITSFDTIYSVDSNRQKFYILSK